MATTHIHTYVEWCLECFWHSSTHECMCRFVSGGMHCACTYDHVCTCVMWPRACMWLHECPSWVFSFDWCLECPNTQYTWMYVSICVWWYALHVYIRPRMYMFDVTACLYVSVCVWWYTPCMYMRLRMCLCGVIAWVHLSIVGHGCTPLDLTRVVYREHPCTGTLVYVSAWSHTVWHDCMCCVSLSCPGCTRYTGVHVCLSTVPVVHVTPVYMCFSTVPGVHVAPVYRRVLCVGYVVVPVHAYTCQHDYTLCDMLYVMCVYIVYT
jgi:hypothetical protein